MFQPEPRTLTPAFARRGRRLATLAAWVLALAAAAWWVFHIPADPLAPFRAIPDPACFVHVSEDPGARWAAIRANPLLPACLSSNALRTVNRLAGYAGASSEATGSRIGRTVFAYVPPSPRLPDGGWYAAARLGSRAHALRWSLVLAPPAEWHSIEGCGGRAAWASREPVDDAGRFLSLSVADGLLVVCLSRDPAGVRFALAAHDRQTPSLFSSKSMDPPPVSAQAGQALEQGWFTPPGRRNRETQTPSLRYAFTRADASGLALTLHWDQPLPLAAPLRHPAELAALAPFAGTNPALVAVLPAESLGLLARSVKASAWSLSLITLLQSGVAQTSNAPLMLAVSTGTEGAGFGKPPLRMPLPAAVLAMPLGSNCARLPEALSVAVNILNTRHKAGLVLNLDPKPGADCFCQIQAPDMKSLLKPTESDLPAVAAAGNWLLASSSGSLLATRLNPATAPPATSHPVSWQHVAPDDSPVSALLWTDLDRMGKAVEDALALWRAVLIWQGSDPGILRELARIKAVTHALRELGAASVIVRASDTSSVWRVTIGNRLAE